MELTARCRAYRQLVRPARGGERTEVEVWPMDALFAMFPIAISGYPSYCFGFGQAPDADVLARSLAEVLSTWRVFAGRFRGDGKAVVLCDSGVPLTARKAKDMDHAKALWRCSDFREPRRAASGREPLLTVQLTRFPSGAGVVALCRSHGVADGSTFAEFMADWAGVIAGRGCPPIQLDRASYHEESSLEDALAMAAEKLGAPARVRSRKRTAVEAGLCMAGKLEMCKLALGYPLSDRPCMFFSHDELEALKRLASKDLKKVPWITTQEAFVANLAKVIPAYFGKGAKVGLLLLLDGKRQIGIKRLCTGTALLASVGIFDTREKSLGELAEEIQLTMGGLKGKAAAAELRTQQETARHNIDMGFGPPNLWKLKDCDHIIMLNNQSKIPLLDLGTGAAEWVASTSGPSLMLPHRDGIRVFFDGRSLPASAAQLPEVEALLHNIEG